MKNTRLEELYKKPLTRPETSLKALPTEFILKKPVTYFPEKPDFKKCDILEIGPGTGDFLFHLASTYPNKKILGIELGNIRFQKIKEKIIKQGLNNITLIHGDARTPVFNEFKNDSLEKCFVLFPDPWPRNKHRHKRLLQKDFLEKLATSLKPNGEFTLATDVKDYATWVLSIANQIPILENCFGENVMENDLPDIIPTFFKKKWITMGRSFWYLRFRKI